MGRRAAALFISLVAFFGVGCQGLGPKAQLTVDALAGGGRVLQLAIVADVGVLTGASSGANNDLLGRVGVIDVQVSADGHRVEVAWVLTLCEREPTLQVERRSPDDIILALDAGRSEPANCDDIGITYGVTLTFRQPVQLGSIRANLLRGGRQIVEPDRIH